MGSNQPAFPSGSRRWRFRPPCSITKSPHAPPPPLSLPSPSPKSPRSSLGLLGLHLPALRQSPISTLAGGPGVAFCSRSLLLPQLLVARCGRLPSPCMLTSCGLSSPVPFGPSLPLHARRVPLLVWSCHPSLTRSPDPRLRRDLTARAPATSNCLPTAEPRLRNLLFVRAKNI